MHGNLQGYIHGRCVTLLIDLGKTPAEAASLADANAARFHHDALAEIQTVMAADPDDRIEFIGAWQSSVRETIDTWIADLA